ncbi:MAG: hypothetical protein AAGF12_05070 [Myxococcota bacterium]
MPRLFSLASLAFTIVACSDDTPDNSGNVPDGQVEVAAEDAGADAETVNLCDNPNDLAAVAREDYSPAMNRDYRSIATECAIMCAIEASDNCVVNCLQGRTEESASAACASCYGGAADCAIRNCRGVCLTEPMGSDCLSCRCGNNDAQEDCVGDFERCAGFPSPLCDGV